MGGQKATACPDCEHRYCVMLFQSPFAGDRFPTTSITNRREAKAKDPQGMGRFANPTTAVMVRKGIAKIRNLGTSNG